THTLRHALVRAHTHIHGHAYTRAPYTHINKCPCTFGSSDHTKMYTVGLSNSFSLSLSLSHTHTDTNTHMQIIPFFPSFSLNGFCFGSLLLSTTYKAHTCFTLLHSIPQTPICPLHTL